MRLPACLAVLLLFVGLCAAETHYLYPTNTTWVATIQAMTAGDIAILAPYVHHVNFVARDVMSIGFIPHTCAYVQW